MNFHPPANPKYILSLIYINGVVQAISTRFVEAPIANHKGVRCASSGVASCQLFRMGGGGGGANEPTEKKITIYNLHV